MKVSLFTEVIIPRPWNDDSEYTKLHESLQQVELADKHGFHAVWVVEHHFLEEYAHSSAPEVFLAAASQRTRNIRLGHGIMNLLPPTNHPLRAAERISTLDLLSDGRVEFGSGEGSSVSEIDGFNVDPGIKKEMWEESLQVCVDAMTQTPFAGISGKFLNIPPRNVVPKPRQKPHPPLWMATTRRERIREAARKGLGALCFYWVEPEASKEWVDEYYKVFEDECVPVGLFANPTVAMTSWTMCAETAGEAALRAIEGIDFHRFSSVHYYQKGPHRPGITDVWGLFESSGEAEKSRQRARDIATGVSARPGTAIGTAEDIISYLRRYEDAGVDEILLGVQSGNMKQEHIMETISRIGEHVLPQFIERDSQAAAAKRKRLEPLLEAAARRRPAQRLAPEDYEHEVVLRAWDSGRAVGGMREAMEIQGRIAAGEREEVLPGNTSD